MGLWEEELQRLSAVASKRTEEERTAKQEVEEEVFKQIFIPRTLIEVEYPERDVKAIKSGTKEEAYQSVTGVKVETEDENDLAQSPNLRKRNGSLSSDCDTSDEVSSNDSDSEEKSKFKDSHRPRHESP